MTTKNMEEVYSQPKSDSSGLMNGRITAILCAVYLVTIISGGLIFHFIETPREETAITSSAAKLNEFLANNTCVGREDLQVFIQEVIEAYDAGVSMSNDTESHETNWDIVSSIFFCTTIVTTVGPGGRVFTVFFALIGIPLFVIVSGQLGIRFSLASSKITGKAVKNIKSQQWKSTVSLLIVFLLGFCINMLLGAGIFSLVEKWTYADALYYTFITLTTVGLGDFVPGFANGSEERNAGVVMYRIFVTIWMIFGLIWMASTISAISDVVHTLAQKSTSGSESQSSDGIETYDRDKISAEK